MKSINIAFDSYLELEKIALGAFFPLNSFMGSEEYESVVESMRLPNGSVFPLPILLPISGDEYSKIKLSSEIILNYKHIRVGTMEVTDIFKPDLKKTLPKVFGTKDFNHPGMSMLLNLSGIFVGGNIKVEQFVPSMLTKYEISPKKTKSLIKKQKLNTIAGFQTRNVPHRAHEYLQRLALEKVDGILIQPIVGRKKVGDFTPDAIMSAYKYLIENFLPKQNIILAALTTFMRYAGPREAVFHSIIRKNYGCTHFIVGRDHAGVEDYYEEYEAQNLCKKLETELGIKILDMKGPYFCSICDGIVTENTCPHKEKEINSTKEISGTKIRSMLQGREEISKFFLRPEIVRSIGNVKLFIEENDE